MNTATANDVTFATRYASGEPTTADFYFNGRAIGSGRQAFAEIVERIRKAPRGTSVVWGPNYDRCGACSGAEPACVPKFLYPDLWLDLEQLVTAQGLTLSSDFPGPVVDHADAIGSQIRPEILAGEPKALDTFQETLDWKIGQAAIDENLGPAESRLRRSPWREFSAVGVDVDVNDYDLELLLGRLPQGGQVLVRVNPPKIVEGPEASAKIARLADDILETWERTAGYALHCGNLKATLAAPPNLAAALKKAVNRDRIVLDWCNYRGPETPPEEVLFLADGRFLGRGNEGFNRLLARIEELPQGAEVTMQRYVYRGRAASESFSPEELDAKNALLRNLSPFAAQKRALDEAVVRRRLNLSFDDASPTLDPRTVVDWRSGDRYGQQLVSFGRIVFHDESHKTAAARLAWTRYELGLRGNGGLPRPREIEANAFYTLNDVEIGRGVAGFAKAMERIAALPAGSIVQVRVCLKTKGPFTCPLVYAGQRHFERTGFEPYFGLFPWLIEVARTHNLELEWLPDERASCGDCELNK